MENRKGSGLFLGIVSVATLIVAIIGATFAYFSASTSSNVDAVNVQAYQYQLSLSVNPIYPEGASALIPLDPDETVTGTETSNLVYALNNATNGCIDDQGLQVCMLYQIVITNNAANEMTLSGVLQTTKNEAAAGFAGREPFKDLKYQALKGDHESRSLELDGTALDVPTELNGTINLPDITVSGATFDDDGKVETPGTGTAYLLIYLNENGNQSSQMGAKYNGQVTYQSLGDNGTENTLTGKFGLTGGQD